MRFCQQNCRTYLAVSSIRCRIIKVWVVLFVGRFVINFFSMTQIFDKMKMERLMKRIIDRNEIKFDTKETARISFRVPLSLKEDLDRKAQSLNMSLSDYLRDIITGDTKYNDGMLEKFDRLNGLMNQMMVGFGGMLKSSQNVLESSQKKYERDYFLMFKMIGNLYIDLLRINSYGDIHPDSIEDLEEDPDEDILNYLGKKVAKYKERYEEMK